MSQLLYISFLLLNAYQFVLTEYTISQLQQKLLHLILSICINRFPVDEEINHTDEHHSEKK